jgi:predicted small metal-binding protein
MSSKMLPDGSGAHAEDMAMMLDCGWSLRQIAAHFSVSADEVIRLIREHVRQERGESSK